MPEGSGPRFAVEASFLILLAVGVAIAGLDPWLIVVVMAVGWLLQVLVELLAWRARPRLAVASGPATAPVDQLAPEAIAPPPEYPPVAEYVQPPPVEVAPAPAVPAGDYDFEFERPAAAPSEGATHVTVAEAGAADTSPAGPGPAAPAPGVAEGAVATPAEALAFHAPDRRERIRLEPLKPRPRRRWFRRTAAEEGDGGRETEG